jgi:hypothetical protein
LIEVKSDASILNYKLKQTDNNERLVGASASSFEFEDSHFSFKNMHSPIMGDALATGNAGTQLYTLPSDDPYYYFFLRVMLGFQPTHSK